MKTPGNIRVLCIITAVALCCGAVGAVPSGELLQQGLYAEEIEGDLQAAIASYEEIVNDASAPANHVAQALYRQGMCYVRLKNEPKATVALTRLVNDYSDQVNLVKKALPVLDDLQFFDPAALMPPDTLAYLELGSPGRQIEGMVDTLKGTPYENPLTALSQMTPDTMSGPGMMIAGFLNPSMMAEFEKIRGYAVGLVESGDNEFSALFVLHPGDSDALRGMIIAGLGMAGMPSDPIEGMPVLQIQDGPSVAYDDKVIFAADRRERLVACVNLYKGVGSEPSLASDNPSFRKIDKFERQRNAATLWVDANNLYRRVLQQPGLPMKVPMIAGMLGVAGIEDLLLTHSIESDGAELNAMVNFKEGVPNMAYELIKTPTLGKAGFEGVPSEAFGLVSVALSTNNPAQLLQLQQLLMMSGNGAPPPAGLLENIEQVALFALPGKASLPEEMPFRPGVVLTCRDKAPVLQTLQGMAGSPGLPPLIIAETNHSVVVAFEPEVIAASMAALGSGPSVLEKGVLSHAVQQQIGKAQKIVLVNAEGVARLVGIQATFDSRADAKMAEQLNIAFGRLAEQVESMTLTVSTDEQPETLSLKAKLIGVPRIDKVLEPIQEIVRIQEQIREELAQRERTERLAKLVPARIMQTQTAPVPDGDLDACWDKATVYPVGKTVGSIHDPEQAEPIPGNEFAADFRMLWDAENLYVFIDVTDSTPNHNPELLWPFSDNTILYIDAIDAKRNHFGSTDYEYAFCWDATAPFMHENKHERTKNVVYKIKPTEKGYRIEAAFPWATLGTPNPSAGTLIGMDVQVSDNQAGPNRNLVLGWQDDTNGTWQHPLLFGRAELVTQQE